MRIVIEHEDYKMYISITHVRQEVKKGIIPSLKFEIELSKKERNEPNHNLLFSTSKLTMQGKNITNTEPTIIGEILQNHITFTTEFQFPRNTIQAIEENRVDDLSLILNINVLHSSQDDLNHIVNSTLVHELKISQKEWSDILHQMGYFESWVMEIARPRIEGMDVVVQHLQKAADSLDIKDYENCMASSRVAWGAFKPLFESKWEHIQKQIDEGSPGETNHDPKSKRVEDIEKKIYNFSHVGIHREAYRVFPQDAILCYQLTVSMIAYLSRWLRNAP